MLVAMCVSRAHADPADDAVAEAQRRAAANDFLGAATKYREAFAVSPRPDLLCNVGVAYYKARDLPHAQRYLAHCLEIGTSLDRAFIDSVKKVLDAVNEKLVAGDFTPVDVLVQPATATFAVGTFYDEPFVGSRRVWFPYGVYALTFHAEGHVDKLLEIKADAHAPVAARVTLDRTPVEPPPPIATGSGAGSGSAVVTPRPQDPPRPIIINPIPKSRVPPIVATTATFFAAVAAVVLYTQAKNKADTAADAQTMDEWRDIADSVQLRERLAWGVGGLAVIGAVASGYLWYRATRGPESHVQVTATGDGATVSLTGRW
jgi:hypothetical protein